MTSITSTNFGGNFRIGGLASGLDTNNIVDELMTIARRPLMLLEFQKSQATDKLTAWRNLNTRVQAIKIQSSRMKLESTFQARTATSSKTDILTATASAGTNNATQTLSVESLAQHHGLASQAYSSNTAEIGTGTFAITINSGTKTITIDENNNTLDKLRDTINNGDYGVSANIAKTGANEYRLLLTSKNSGLAGEITIDANLEGGTTPTFTTTQAAQDAHVKLGTGEWAISIYSSTNTISGVIEGVTLNLVSASPGTPVTVTLNTNTSQVRTSINNFIEQFNNLVSFFDEQAFFDVDSGDSGVLFSSTELNQVKNGIYSAVLDPVRVQGKFRHLTDLGISLTAGGKLAITNETQFNDAITKNLEDVTKFFTDKDHGLAVKLDTYLNNILDSTGVITATDKHLTEQISEINKRIDVREDYMVRMEQDYYRKFGAMEAVLAELQAQSNYIGMQIQSLMTNYSMGGNNR
jgi:flagellar hook-associated protein 2